MYLSNIEGRGGSAIECLTPDREVAGSNLSRGTALCPCTGHFIFCSVLVQHRITHPDMTEKVLTGINTKTVKYLIQCTSICASLAQTLKFSVVMD